MDTRGSGMERERTEGRVAVITGASRGIGAGLARSFHARGLRLGLCARSEPDRGAVPEDPERVLERRVDVRDLAALEDFAEEVESRLGPIDLWVNNAGLLAPIGMTREVPPEAFARIVEVNLLGVYHGCRVHLRRLHAAGRRGTIVNIGSGAAVHAYEGWGGYCATKAAVHQLTRVLAREEKGAGNRVYCLMPGVIASGMQELIRGQDEADFPAVGRFRELHREGQLLDPESPAPAVLRLAFGPVPAVEDPVLDASELPRW